MAKKISRRLVSVLLVLMLLIGMIPMSILTTHAFGDFFSCGQVEFNLYSPSDFEGIECVDVTDEHSITFRVAPNKSNVRFYIENSGFYPGVASFSIETEGSGTLTYSAESNAKVTKVPGTSNYNIYLPDYNTANRKVIFTINTTNYTEDTSDREYVVTFRDCNQLVSYNYSASTTRDYSYVDLLPTAGGSFTATYDGYTTDPITGGYADSLDWYLDGGPITLSATAASGYTFVCFADDEDYIVPASYYPLQDDEAVTVHAVFAGSTTPAFQVGRKVFTDLGDATAYAATSGGDILVLKGGTVAAGDYTIPEGSTLLVPFSNDYIAYTTHPEVVYSHSTPSAFRTLTLASGANITVEADAAICVSSKLSGYGTGSGSWNGTPTGKHGRIHMNAGSSIEVVGDGSLYAWGYISGAGEVTARRGANIHEALQFRCWRGGTATMSMQSGVFPMNQYYLQNIEVPLTLFSGATEYVYTSVNMSGSCDPMGAIFIGDGGIFQLNSGYLIKDYIESTDRLQFDVYGNMTLNDLSMSVSIATITTANYTNFPLTNNLTININSGTTTTNARVALLPGVQVSIAQGATLLAKKKIAVYDSAQWGNYAGSGAQLIPVGYSTANGTTAKRTAASLTDAVIDVNGLLNVNTAYFYTTSGGAQIISSQGTGAVKFTTAPVTPLSTSNSKPSGTSAYDRREAQATQSGTDISWAGIPLTVAKLYNTADSTYRETAGTAKDTIYCNSDGKWYQAYLVRWLDGSGNVVGWTEGAASSGTYTFSDSVNGYNPTWDLENEYPVWGAPVTNGYIKNITIDHLTTPFTITWIDGNGNVLKTSKIGQGDTPVYTGATPTKNATASTSYTFNGTWSPAITAATGDAAYTAQFDASPRTYTITWVDGNGTTIKTEQVAYGTTPAYTGSTPTKTATAQYSYTFNGSWSPAIVPVSGNATYTAQFDQSVRTYTITWKNGNNGVLKSESLEYGVQPVYTGSTPTKNQTASTVYTFNGTWKSGTIVYATADIPTVTKNATYIAQFDSADRPYTITWKLDASTVIDTTTVDYGTVPTHANPTKASSDQYDYTFTGWTPELTAVTGAATYTAVFEESVRNYTVTFENYDGAVLQSTQVAYGSTPAYTGATPTRAADAQYTYAFSGWSSEISEVTGDVTYTAQYSTTVNNYTVTWKNYNGTTLETDADVPYGTAPSYDSAAPTKAQTADYVYIFEGWSTDGSTVIDPLPAVSGNVTYQAVFREREKEWCTVSWEVNGVIVETDRVRSGDEPSYNGAEPTKAADAQFTYTFDGWCTDGETVISPLPEVTDDVTYIAHYSTVTNTYTVTWKNGDATIETDTNVPYGTLPTYDGETPTKEPTTQYTFTFNGWDPEISEVTGNATYTAAYTQAIRSYLISWAIPLGSGSSEPAGVSKETVDGVIDSYAQRIYDEAKAAGGGDEAWAEMPVFVSNFHSANINSVLTETYNFTASEASYITRRILGNIESNSSETTAADNMWDDVKDTIVDELTNAPNLLSDADKSTLNPAPVSAGVSKETVDGVIDSYAQRIYNEAKAAVDADTWDGMPAWVPAFHYSQVNSKLTGTYGFSANEAAYIAHRIIGNVENKSSEITAADNMWDNVKDTIADQLIAAPNLLSDDDKAALTPAPASITASQPTVDYAISRVAVRLCDEASAAMEYWDDASAQQLGYTKEIQMAEYLRRQYGFTSADSTYIAYIVCGQVYGRMNDFDTADSKWADAQSTVANTFYNAAGLLSDDDKAVLAADNAPAFRVVGVSAVPYGDTPAYSGETPAKTGDKENGYVFDGWSTDGETVLLAIPSVTGDADYLAVFHPATTSYTVRWTTMREPYTEEEIYDAVIAVIYAHAQDLYDANPPLVFEDVGVTVTTLDTALTKAGLGNTNSATNKYVYNYINYYVERKASQKAAADALWDSVKDSIAELLMNASFVTAADKADLDLIVNLPLTVIDTDIVPYGGTPAYTGSTPTKDADAEFTYTFAGWSADGVTELESFPAIDGADFPDTTVTYIALFDATPTLYTVLWKNGDETLETDSEVTYGVAATYDGEEPTKTADAQYTYTFAGWSADGENVLDTIPAASDSFPETTVTFTAVFTPALRSYTVTFKNGEATVETDANVPYGTTPTFDSAEPTKVADAQYTYTFAGWSTDGATVLDPLPEVTGDMTFFALYVPTVNTYTVTWMNGEEIAETDESVEYGVLPTYDGETPTKEGTAQTAYVFTGWSPAVVNVTGNATYTAVFEETARTFTATWKNGDSVIETDSDLAYGTAASYDGAAPTKANAVFLGWDYSYVDFGSQETVTGTVKTGDAFPNVEADIIFTAIFKDKSTNPNADETEIFFRHSLSANADVGVNFYLDIEPYVAEGMDYSNMHVEYRWGSDGKSYSASEAVVINPDNGMYESSVAVAAKEMNDTITAVLYGDDGSKIATHTYKATDYLNAIVNAEDGTYDVELVNLCKSMLVYSAAAQKWFYYNTSNLAVSDEIANNWKYDDNFYPGYNLGTFAQYDVTTGAYSDLTAADLNDDYYTDYYGLALSLKSDVQFNIVFRNRSGMPLTATACDKNNSSLTYTVNRTVLDGTPSASSDGIGDYVSFDIIGIPAAKLCDDITFTIGGQEFTVNPASYMYSAIDLVTTYHAYYSEDTIQALEDVIYGLYNYNRKAIAYFNR